MRDLGGRRVLVAGGKHQSFCSPLDVVSRDEMSLTVNSGDELSSFREMEGIREDEALKTAPRLLMNPHSGSKKGRMESWRISSTF